MNEEILARVKTILFSHFGEFEVKYETAAKDVDGWDSLMHYKIIREIQDEFNVKFNISDLRSFTCVGKIVENLDNKLNH